MSTTKGLKAPQNIQINFQPSEKQFELWKLLQPDYCPKCGGRITQQLIGYDVKKNPQYRPTCETCGNTDLPQLILGGGAAGGGKALSVNDLVLSPSGFIKMKDVQIGTEVCTQNGDVSKIIAIHPQGKKQLWKITTNDGISVSCCDDHIWKVNLHDKSGGHELITDTKHLRELFKANKKISIPLCEQQQLNKKYDSFIHPYIIGFLIGDGGMTGGKITFTTVDAFIVNKISQLLPPDCQVKNIPTAKYGYCIYNKKHNERGYVYSPFKNEIERLKLNCKSDKKRVPEFIMNGCIDVRLSCVQGLMDSDGYVDARGHCSFSVCNKGLAEDFLYLVRSLGAKATITSTVKYCIYKGETKYAVSYNVLFNSINKKDFVTLPRKKERIHSVKIMPRFISSIEDAGTEDAQCITIEDPSGMFVTNGFLPTHNSYLGSVWLISSCMRFENIRAVVARKTIKSLKESTWNTIKTVLKAWGLKEEVNYKINNLEGTLTFWNDSVIIMKEMVDLPSDPNFERFGSSEYTIAMVDEVSEISEKAIEVLFSRLRWRTHETFKTSRMFMSTNPTTNWVRSRFVQDENGDKVVCREGEAYVPFSVFDNPDIAFRQTYEAALNKIRDQATKERLLYGNWDFVEANDMAIYHKFDGGKHLITGLKEKVYDPTKTLISLWDFNVAPQMSTILSQIDYDKKKVYILEEVLGKPENKENNTPALARKIKQKLYREKQIGGVDVSGDPAGLQRSTATEDGVNNFTVIADTFGKGILRPKIKLLKKQPPQTKRCDFVNEVFDGYDGWEIQIDIRCRKLTEDLIYQLKNEDGTKSKAKVTDPKTGVKYEKYGHLSDCLDYLLCYYLRDSWKKYQRGDDNCNVISTATVYEGFNY